MRQFTVNARGKDGYFYPLYFECETVEQAEIIVKQLNLAIDDAGISELVWEAEWDEIYEESDNGRCH